MQVEYEKYCYFRQVSRFVMCCQHCDHQMLSTRFHQTVAGWLHSSLVIVSSGVCRWQQMDNEVFMTRSLNVTRNTTKQHLIYAVVNL